MTNNGKTREGYAVELYFDPKSEDRVLSLRETMYQETGVVPMLGKLGDRPHVSLAVFGCIDPQPLMNCCEPFFEKIEKFTFELSAIGTFPTRDNVIYLTPVPESRLLDLHAQFHQVLKQNRIKSSIYYLPGRWIPHCTIEFEVIDADLGRALEFFQKRFEAFSGTFTHAGVVGFRPVEYLADYELKG